jgi:hypothetical protein
MRIRKGIFDQTLIPKKKTRTGTMVLFNFAKKSAGGYVWFWYHCATQISESKYLPVEKLRHEEKIPNTVLWKDRSLPTHKIITYKISRNKKKRTESIPGHAVDEETYHVLPTGIVYGVSSLQHMH